MFPERTLLLSSILSLAVAASACAGLHWENEFVFVSSAPGEGKAVGHFPFTNTGSVPVKIESFKTSCGCTAASAEKRLIAPGEKGEVVVTYSTTGRHGLKEAPVTVKTDDPQAPISTLRFRVLIQNVLELQPTSLLWTEAEPLQPKRIAIKVTEGFSVKDIRATCTEASLGVRLETVKAGSDYLLWVTPPEGKGFKAKIDLLADYPSDHPKPVTAHIRVR